MLGQCVPAWGKTKNRINYRPVRRINKPVLKLVERTCLNNQGETMKALAFSTRFVRPALRSITFCFSVVLISSMTMVKLAHASGVVSSSQNWATSLSGIGAFCLLPSLSASVACYAQFATQNPNTYYVDGYCHTPISTVLTSATTAIYTFSQTRYPDCGSPYSHTKFFQVFSITCPLNSTPTGTTCTCNDGYAPDPAGTSCVPVPVVTCAAPSVPDGAGGCACNPPNRINSIGECTACPVDPLPKPSFPGDTEAACTASLEKGNGADIDKACRPLDTRWTEPSGGQLQCLADKIHMLGLAYTKPTATIRTVAYQQHLVDVWNKSIEIENKDMTPEQEQTCTTVIANVDREMSQHGLDAPPSKKNSKAPHVLGIAIDIPRVVKDAMIAQVSNTTTVVPVNCFLNFCMSLPVHIKDVQDYINSDILNPPACNLRWGGRFDPYDPVHLQLF